MALEMQRQCRLAFRVARDKGLIITSKNQAMFNFLQEADKLTDEQKLSIAALAPEDR